MYVYWVCCVGSGLCDGLIYRSEESCRIYASMCDLETSKRDSIVPIRAAAPQEKKTLHCIHYSEGGEAYTKLNLERLPQRFPTTSCNYPSTQEE